MKKTIVVDGVEYEQSGPRGSRAVVVVDRGWIFAGDVTENAGRIVLTRAVWILNWSEIGFDGLIKDPLSKKVNLRTISDVDLPAGAEIFRIPVGEDWGLR